jgi:hypothetical protein
VFGAALVAAVLTGTDLQPRAFAQSVPSGGALAVQTDIFNKVYEGGVARLARGDYASAARTFNILAKIAPEMHEMQYSLAVATTLADFERREWSLPLIQSALAAEPNNALYQFVQVISDPSLSGLRGDALYFSRDGAEMISRITPRLAENGASRNSRFLAPVLATTVKNDDQQWPARLPGFKALVTPGGSVKMPQWTDSVSLGQLLALSIPPERFAPFEHRIIAQLEAGLASLNPGSVDGQKTRGTPTR